MICVGGKLVLIFVILQVPFPMGVNMRPRSSKNRAGTSEESYQESKDFIIEESVNESN